jgi:ABC-2 type transport system permease protein
MEYRASFITQVLGMMLNNGMYFVFWVLFFDRFKRIQGWGLSEMFMLFGVVAAGFGLTVYLFGNLNALADVIVTGKLDYYLSLPRPVLLHVLASSSRPSGMGDFIYGILSFLVAGQYDLNTLLRFTLGLLLSMTIFLSFMVAVQSLAFWFGNTQQLSQQAYMAMITFSIYPINLFDGTAKLLLFTVLPAALIGALPAEFIKSFSWTELAALLGAALGFLALAIFVFYRGLRRYESGSAIQVQV